MPTPRRGDISDTLRQRVLSALHFGTLGAGDRLPSARTLAGELDADPRVVTAAYRQLERDGLVERRPPSRAYFVAAPTGPGAGGGPAPMVEWFVELFAGGLARGIGAPDFPEQARRALETLRLRAACVESSHDHLVWLARELQDDYGIAATTVDADALRDVPRDAPSAASDDGPLPWALRTADLVVTTAAHADLVAPIAARLGRPLVVATVRPDLAAQVARLLAAGAVWFVGTDARFEARVRELFDGPDVANVRTVLVGRDDVAAIPDRAPAWVMRTARDLLGGVPPHVRPLSTLRAFSPETRRELLRFVVRANVAVLGTRG